MKRAGLILALMMIMVMTGCSNDKTSMVAPEANEAIRYGLGERAVIENEYALTILYVEELENNLPMPWYEENHKSILVEYLFENLSMDEEHELNYSELGPVNGMELRIPNMDPHPPVKFHDIYGSELIPVRTKSIQKVILPFEGSSDMIRFRFHDPYGRNPEFEAKLGERAEVNLEGSIPEVKYAYKIGEPMVLAKAANDYTVTVDSVKKVEIDRPDPDFIGGADYEVELIFSNMDLDKSGGKQFNLTMIDQHGIAGYRNQIFGVPVELEDGKGVRTSVYFSTHTESEKLLLYYTDSLLDRNEGFYIEIDEIN